MRLDKEVNCPYCQSVKVVRNGVKKSGRQNLLCRHCGKQFQFEYTYKACDHGCRQLVHRMLLRGSGVRDCAAVARISKETVLRMIATTALKLEIKPRHHSYNKVQIDEQWSYVGRKQRKVWMIYAYAVEYDEIIGFAMGKRNCRTISNLLIKLKALEIDFFLTDSWEAFKAVLPRDKHLIGKQFTKAIEGVNTWFRTRLRRLVRRTVCFSKKLIYHHSIIKMAIYHRNLRSSYI